MNHKNFFKKKLKKIQIPSNNCKLIQFIEIKNKNYYTLGTTSNYTLGTTSNFSRNIQ